MKIKIHTVGVCGSDVHYYTHGRIGRFVAKNVTVFADGEVDRSPCGSGTSARLALLGLGLADKLARGRPALASDRCWAPNWLLIVRSGA